MILARNSITLHHLRDITTVVWYYKLQASTASPPAKPTTATPSGWNTTEPSYTEGSTNSLYVVQKTTFSDGTFEYSDVSLSTSYEAAKAAYNKSVQAQTTANAAQESIDNLEIGGRNLLLNTNNFDSHKYQNSSGGGTWTFSGDEATYTATAKSWARLDLSYNPDMPSADISSQPNMDLLGDTTITLSIEAKCEGECNGILYLQPIIYGNNNNRKYYPLTNPTADCKNTFVLTENWQRYSVTLPADYTNTTYWTSDSTQLSYPNTGFGALIYWNSTGTIHVRKPKLEKGTKATDWTPAPEDLQADIDTLQPELIVGTHGTTDTATWTGTSTVLTELKAGTRIQYKLSSKGASNVTLNLTLKSGATTGAKAVYFVGNTRLGTQYDINAVVDLIYDGSAWRVLNPYYNSNTVGTYGGTVTAGANGVKNYSLVMRDTETTWVSLTTTAGTGTSKNRYTGKLYPDKVMYMGSNSAYASGATTGTCYEALGVNLQYSTNCGSTLTSGRAVYLVGTLDSDGLFTLDATWWTQTIPTTADGKTYIYLGLAYSTTNIYLVPENTLYQYFEGAFRTLREIEELKAAKTADNYLSSDNTGIMVADMTDGNTYTPSTVPSGTKNTFINEDSFQVRDGKETLASFGTVSQIGADTDSHLMIDTLGIRGIDIDGRTLFNIAMSDGPVTYMYTYTSLSHLYNDINSEHPNLDVTNILTRPSLLMNCTLLEPQYNVVLTHGDGSESTDQIVTTFTNENVDYAHKKRNTVAKDYGTFYIEFWKQNNGNEIRVNIEYTFGNNTDITNVRVYFPNIIYSGRVTARPSFSLGTRSNDDMSTMGSYSATCGEELTAGARAQFACGKFNADNPDYAFMVGNGDETNGDSNAFAVTWDGNHLMALDEDATTGTDADLYAAITALGWESKVLV